MVTAVLSSQKVPITNILGQCKRDTLHPSTTMVFSAITDIRHSPTRKKEHDKKVISVNKNVHQPSSQNVTKPCSKDANRFVVHLSLRFLVCTVVYVTFIAFTIGFSSKLVLKQPKHGQRSAHVTSTTTTTTSVPRLFLQPLPSPVLAPGKHLPHFIYSSKTFEDGSCMASESCFIRTTPHVAVNTSLIPQIIDEEQEFDDEEHAPAGHHLFVDIENVDRTFLNSEKRLADGMLTLVKRSGLTLLSYHCHKLPSAGVSCIGVLLESHVSFHTWPSAGVITLDLFTCGPTPLIDLVPDMEELFAVPQCQTAGTTAFFKPPHVKWAHKLRGFRPVETAPNRRGRSDLNPLILGWREYDSESTEC